MAVRVPRELSNRDPEIVAPLAGLRYLPPGLPGWSRRRQGSGFSFWDERGNRLSGLDRGRLVALAVPPAWEDVWLAPVADGHLQATGFDEAGRKQYRYHPDYRSMREARKFARMRYFGRALPALRDEIAEALAAPPHSLRLAIGAVLGTIDAGLLRVGNEQSSAEGHFGATTLHVDHVEDDGHITLTYSAKAGKERTVVIDDEDLSDVLADLADRQDGRLFEYLDDAGRRRPVTAVDVNAVIARVAGPAFSAKDFRTWGGSRQALVGRVEGLSAPASVDAAADALGNTRAVARSSYVHPTVLEAPADEIATAWASSRRTDRMARADRALVKLLAP